MFAMLLLAVNDMACAKSSGRGHACSLKATGGEQHRAAGVEQQSEQRCAALPTTICWLGCEGFHDKEPAIMLCVKRASVETYTAKGSS